MQEEIPQRVDESLGTIYPIQFVQVGELSAVSAPLVRLSTCGSMTIEVLQEVVCTNPPQGRYVVVTPRQRRRGSTTGRNLLSALVSLPGHYAAKSWLTERLCRYKSEDDEDDDWPGMVRVDNIVTLLRGLLCPPGIAGEKELRKALVSYELHRFESGPGYQLAGEPLIWLDVDVIEASVKEACLLERKGQDAFPIWERAYTLAARGGYLLDERYSDWAESKRREVEGYQRQAVHALHRLYLARNDGFGEEQVLLLLRSYWQTHPMDEDVLRPLLELLGKLGRVQEAEEYYLQLCQELELEGLMPHPRTQRIIQHISSLSKEDKIHTPLLPVISQSTAGSYEPMNHKELQESGSLQEQNLDSRTNVGRREVAKYLGILGLTLFTAPHKVFDSFSSMASKRSRVDRETLSLFSTLTETCLLLSEGSQLTTAECVLWSYLPEVEAFALQPSEHQKLAANITSQGYLIAASLVGHHNDLQTRQRFSEQALLYGNLAQDYTLQVAALRQLAATFSYLKLPQKVMQTYQCALPFVDNVPQLLRSCIYAGLSGAYAQLHQKQDAYRFIGLAYESFGEHWGDEPYFLRAINASQNLLIHWDGKNHLLLGEPRMAENVFMQLDVLDSSMKLPKRIRVEAINNRAKMFIAVRNMEQACIYIEAAVKMSVEIGSRLRFQEVFTTFQSLKSTWPNEKRVRELDDIFIQHLVNHVH